MRFILPLILSIASLALSLPRAQHEFDALGLRRCTNCVYAKELDSQDPATESKRAAFESANPNLRRCLDCVIQSPDMAITERDSPKDNSAIPVKRCFSCYFGSNAGGSGGTFDPNNPGDKAPPPTTPTKKKRCFSCYFGSSSGGSGGSFEPGNPPEQNPDKDVPVKAKRCFSCYFGSTAGGSGGTFDPNNPGDKAPPPTTPTKK
ncbi:hypothetical protein M3J07_002491 [Ascochyta lentis]